jgi:hypothetical protein
LVILPCKFNFSGQNYFAIILLVILLFILLFPDKTLWQLSFNSYVQEIILLAKSFIAPALKAFSAFSNNL